MSYFKYRVCFMKVNTKLIMMLTYNFFLYNDTLIN